MCIAFDQTEVEASGVAGHLRSLKRLAVVELDLPIRLILLDCVGKEGHESRGEKTKACLKVWKSHLIRVLKESPSNERKLLRWKVTQLQFHLDVLRYVVVENGELEVLPET